MHSLTYLLAAFVLALSILDGLAKEEVSCKSIMGEMTKRQLQGISKCTKSMKFKNGKEKSQKMMCILKCVMANEGILSAEGKMDKETFAAFLEKEVPPSMKDRAKEVLGKCRDAHGDALDPSDEFCKSYDPLIKCFMGAVMQLCPS
ncbi:unnamed protein product [Allacma fusca]|uniref:Uncharacterized protein n=1 Tax=Allacma fusca TaxID=39272 RepID=A0A8J2J2D8_9HEXA|nr:unnamed protein product [Allacma fusca]